MHHNYDQSYCSRHNRPRFSILSSFSTIITTLSSSTQQTSFGIGAMYAKSDRFDKKDSSVDMSIPGPGEHSLVYACRYMFM